MFSMAIEVAALSLRLLYVQGLVFSFVIFYQNVFVSEIYAEEIVKTDTNLKTLPTRHTRELKVFAKSPKDSTFTEGELAFLECLGADSHIQLWWEKGGLPLKDTNNIAILKSGYIFIDNAKPQHSGLYSCVAKDSGAAYVSRASAFLQINPKMKIDEFCGKPRIIETADQGSNPKILYGHDAMKGAHPWQVIIVLSERNKFYCSGVLLNERWVVTAAQCFHTSDRKTFRKRTFIVKFGKHDFAEEEKHEYQIRIFDYSSFIFHPAFNTSNLDNDIALIRLTKSVPLSDYIIPICLPDRELAELLLRSDENNSTVKFGVVTGWGSTEKQLPARYLQELNLPIVDQKLCNTSPVPLEILGNTFCAGFAQALSVDACDGDSGGPFAMLHEGRWYLIGLVSFGVGCDREGHYGYYTRISNYVEWIKAIINS